MRQLQSRDTELQSAILTNPYTRICFRVGDMDARSLESGFAFFEGKDLQNLGRGEAVVRVERSDYDFNLETYPLPETREDSDTHIQSVIERSRQNYGTPLAEVEELLRQARAPVVEEPPTETVRETEPPGSIEPVDIVEDVPKKPIITPPPKPKSVETPKPKKKPKEKAQLGQRWSKTPLSPGTHQTLGRAQRNSGYHRKADPWFTRKHRRCPRNRRDNYSLRNIRHLNTRLRTRQCSKVSECRLQYGRAGLSR